MNDYFNATGTIGFTCDNCGRELLGCTWVNGMRFCAKCYQETFGNTNPFEKELRDKIADLEAKLAEKEERIKWLVEYEWNRKWAKKYIEMRRKEDPKLLFPDTDEVYQRYFELKQQLAEKEKEIEKWKSMAERSSNLLDRFSRTGEIKTQDKISFAVDILEKLADCSNYINSKLDFECGSYVSEKAIRDKIKYLKGKKDE